MSSIFLLKDKMSNTWTFYHFIYRELISTVNGVKSYIYGDIPLDGTKRQISTPWIEADDKVHRLVIRRARKIPDTIKLYVETMMMEVIALHLKR